MNRRVPQDNENLIHVLIPPGVPAPVKRPPSSRELARRREKAEATARAASAARELNRQVQLGLRSPPGRLFVADAEGLILCGPGGGIGSTLRMIETLEPLAQGGRHPAEALIAAGGWKDEATLREALGGMAPKLFAVGLRVCRKKAGLRMAKAKA